MDGDYNLAMAASVMKAFKSEENLSKLKSTHEFSKHLKDKDEEGLTVAELLKFESIKKYKLPQKLKRTYELGGEYILSKQECNLFSEMLETDKYPYSPMIEYVRECKRLTDNEDKLAEMRQENIRRREDLQQQWTKLAEDEQEFRLSFIKFNKFVVENKAKRERAEKKMNEDRKLIEKRTAAVGKLIRDVESLKRAKENLEKLIRKNMVFENFISVVVSQSDEFKNILDVINRFETLVQAKEVLAKKNRDELSVLENSRNEMVAMVERYDLIIMGLYTQVADLREKYKLYQIEMLHTEDLVDKIKRNYVIKQSEIFEVKKAIIALFRLLNTNAYIYQDIDETNFEEMLVFIKNAILRLVRLNKVFTRDKRKRKFS